ncbi:MAG: UDP-glucose--hexose-1-phosphate uridylyltransferase [Clostridia bacterium]|nr:UDP-glucose--hexose-1-phosphate uridylyltransferase [Clostridia bacterium]
MTTTITEYLHHLLDFAEEKLLIEAEDREYTFNRLLEIVQLDGPECERPEKKLCPETATCILEPLMDLCAKAGVFPDSGEQRDLFSAKLMGALTPHPLTVRDRFQKLYDSKGPEAATQYFYDVCRYTDYIRVDRIANNVRFFRDTQCGELEITINLSKPEKDPRDIAAQRNAKATGYPKCMLCVENPGYAGRPGFPARQNHRVVPLTLAGNPWYLQYSPYAYYDEHCIVFNREHVPMKISHDSFVRLFDFVEQFPHYFLGSNADLPIVGGSILSHDHFQGGGYTFPMDRAGVRTPLNAPCGGVEAWVSDWPMTCIVLKGECREDVISLADQMLDAWRGYSDPDCGIFAETDGTPHNTITPVARMEDGKYKLYLVLRNNITTVEHPLGVFHPHAQLHHIKKENIGLIEVMGLFILPGRLVKELAGLEKYLTGETALSCAPEADSPLEKHYAWVQEIASKTGTSLSSEEAAEALRDGLAAKCALVLKDAGVYKQTPEGDAGLLRFLESIGYSKK